MNNCRHHNGDLNIRISFDWNGQVRSYTHQHGGYKDTDSSSGSLDCSIYIGTHSDMFVF